MPATLITGPARSGKTTTLRRRYLRWLQEGVRTDQILILTHGAGQTAPWRRGLDLPESGPIEAHDFYGFIRQELTLHWATAQARVPALRRWITPEFLPLAVECHLLRGLLEPMAALFADVVKAAPERLALQLITRLERVGAAAGLEPEQAVRRVATADRPEKGPLYLQVEGLLARHRARCLAAGLLDYGLALYLFTAALLPDPRYRSHLQGRIRRLLVDDLDEAVPVELEFLAGLGGAVEEAALALDPEGGHRRIMGADPAAALALFGWADRLELETPGGDVEGRLVAAGRERLSCELWGGMVAAAAEAAADLVHQGVEPGEIALIAPRVDNLLHAALRRALAARSVSLQSLTSTRRLLDEPAVRAIVVLAGLVRPEWRLPWPSPGFVSDAVRLLLRLEPAAAAELGEVLWRFAGDAADLPELPDPTGSPDRPPLANLICSPDPPHLANLTGAPDPPRPANLTGVPDQPRLPDLGAAAVPYRYLRHWIAQARRRTWRADAFVQAALVELLLPLRPDIAPEQVDACRQLLRTAAGFRLAGERLGPGAFGPSYRPLLTEATAPLLPPEGLDDSGPSAVLLATPYDYLSRRLVSTHQIWLDASSPAWHPSDVLELANPHVLSRAWEEGERWTDAHVQQVRQASAARTVRGLVRRCTGRVLLVEASLSPLGREQEGGLYP